MARLFATVVAFAALAAATLSPAKRDTEPCYQIAQILGQSNRNTFDSDLALSCLRSVPLDKSNNVKLLESYKAMMEFQSDLTHLKQAMPGMLHGPIDVMAGIDDIGKKLQNDYYKNEYDFQSDLFRISTATYNYYSYLAVDIILAFTWNRPYDLISVSKDGTSLPDVYCHSDLTSEGQMSNNASPVVEIDGTDVETWLNDLASKQPYGHDPDASYNRIFWDLLQQKRSLFSSTWFPLNNTMTLKFANQTTIFSKTSASSTKNLTNVTDGASFFEQINPRSSSASSNTSSTSNKVKRLDASDTSTSANASTASDTMSTSTTATSTTATSNTALVPWTSVSAAAATQLPATGFPSPYLYTKNFDLSGYLPDATKDLAILRLANFGTFIADEVMLDYQNTLRSFLATAQAQGRKKLIIDVRGNQVGIRDLVYDVFMHIWPTPDNKQPQSAANLRSTQLFRDIVQVVHNYSFSVDAGERIGGIHIDEHTTFDDSSFIDQKNNYFDTPQQFYNPNPSYGDNFTAICQPSLQEVGGPNSIQLPGNYYNRIVPIPQVFAAPDIIWFTDGACGSECADAAELFKNIANVKSIVVGGRKQMGPMQALGGPKGRLQLTLDGLKTYIGAATLSKNLTLASAVRNASTALIADDHQILWQRSSNGTAATVNAQNGIRVNDSSVTPLQYVYEAADCRFFYTSEMLVNQSLVWQRVYDIAWNGSPCVPGSADHPSSLSGKLLSYQQAYPPVGANYTFGAKGQAWPDGIENPASSLTNPIAPSMAPTGGPSLFAKSTTYLGDTPMTSATSSIKSAYNTVPPWLTSSSSSSKGGAAMPTAAVRLSGLAGVGVALVAGIAL